ncbi:MAG: PHP domain-containing protein [Clostridiales bacterium]|jgi:PHP family Zn ribbon phosphoesterase|nr:PHP domain-containing protein [Clostridiales bacterium]
MLCDLHIHTALSPCADDDMTPNNIIGMSVLNGLSVVAITDHNSCRNVRACREIGQKHGIYVIPGMELTTQEEIHIVCLFPDVSDAEAFSAAVYDALPPIVNKPRVFGNQLVYDGRDVVTAHEERLLITATRIPVTEVVALVAARRGICYPAHIDREANGILSILGDIHPELRFAACEFSPRADEAVRARYAHLTPVTASDAHALGDIADETTAIPLPAFLQPLLS